MLGLFKGTPLAPSNSEPDAAAAANKPGGGRRRQHGGGGGLAATVAVTPGGKSVSSFNAPDAEGVLGMRRLLVKIVGASHLPESVGARRSCSAEVQLVDEHGTGAGSAIHERTGPPNHFTTVKDTAPVWNSEFVAELPFDLLTSNASLRFVVWDDAASPAAHLGEGTIHASELKRLCMREDEFVLSLQPSAGPSAAAVAQAIARGDKLPTSGGDGAGGAGGSGGTLKVRLAYIDVRAAMSMLASAEGLASEAAAIRDDSGEVHSRHATQLKILTKAMREEEERAQFFLDESKRGDSMGGAAAAAAREREDARVKRIEDDSATLLSALKEEKKQAMEAVLNTHNSSLAAFAEDLAAHAAQTAASKEEALAQLRADIESERGQLERQREEARRLAFDNAQEVIEAVESNARAETTALQDQHAAALAAMQAQLTEQLARERKAMENELESRTKLVGMQVAELKAAHDQQLADMKASMTTTISDYERSSAEAQRAARDEVRQAAGEHEAQLKALKLELARAREGPSAADEEMQRKLRAAELAAKEQAETHDKEVAYVKEALKRRAQEQQAALQAMSQRLESRGEALEAERTQEMEEMRAELSQREVQQSAAHKEELTTLKAAYNDSIDRLKAEMLALIEERASSAETSKREYEKQLLHVKRLHLEEMESVRQSMLDAEREAARRHEATVLAKVSEYEAAVAEMRETTLAAFASEQRASDGALPALQERLEAAAREHEHAAAELLSSMEAKLAMQAELHSGEFEGMRSRYEHALDEARRTSEAALQQLDEQSQAREAELVGRLEAQSQAAIGELEVAAARSEEAIALAMARAREEKEAAVEQCNAHWMGVVSRQSAAAASAAETAERAHAERLATEVGKVASLEEAAMKQVEEASVKLREVEAAVRKAGADDVNAAAVRHERQLKTAVAKLQQEMSLRLEEERRRWASQAEVASRASSEERAQAISMLDDQHTAALELAESQIAQLSDTLKSERAAYQRSLDEQWSELAGKHASELEEQHAWYLNQLSAFERDRDGALEELTSHLDTSLANLREQQRDALTGERELLDTAVGRLQADQQSALEAMATEASKQLQGAMEGLERQKSDAQQRLVEDQEHRARVNQAELRRLEQHTSEMRNLLIAEREQWQKREAQSHAHHEELVAEVREQAYEQATVEHQRVLRDAAAQGAEMTTQHEAALAAALAQKDEQLGARLSEYEGQLARMVTGRAELQASTREQLLQAAKQCEAARSELAQATASASAAVAQAVGKLGDDGAMELRATHEAQLEAQRALHATELEAVAAQHAAGETALLGRLAEIRAESHSRHRHTAQALGEAVKQLHVRREAELGSVAAEHATALDELRSGYEIQLRRQAKMSEELLSANNAKEEGARAQLLASHEAAVAALETQKQKLAEAKTKGWAHLPLPNLVRQAMEESLEEVRTAHSDEVAALIARHAKEVEALKAQASTASAEGLAALQKAIAASDKELGLSLGEARLQHEEERTRMLEEVNARAEAELSALREEQAEAARRHLAAESKRVAAEEAARVGREVGELRAAIAELEIDNARGQELRSALSRDADAALLAEVERLNAELQMARKAIGVSASSSAAPQPRQQAGAAVADSSRSFGSVPPTPAAGARPKPPAKTTAPRPQSRGRGRG